VRFSFFLKEAGESLRRNWVMTIASVMTVFISMAILGMVMVTDRNLNQGATSLKQRVQIEVFIKDTISSDTAQIAALQQKIQAMPQVKSVTYTSKDQALLKFKEMMGSDANRILSNLTTNPLPASFVISVRDPNEVDAVAAQFFTLPWVANDPGTTNGVKYAKQTVRRLLGTIGLVEKGMWATTVLFSAAAILLISTTVRLSIFARRREIEIMQLVGATNWFIRWPFVLEGFFTGLLGSVVAALVVWGVNYTIFKWVSSSSLQFLHLSVYPPFFKGGTWPLGVLPTLSLLGAALGALGSVVALRRYLRV